MLVLSAIGLFHSFVFKMAVDQVLEFMKLLCFAQDILKSFQSLLSDVAENTTTTFFGS